MKSQAAPSLTLGDLTLTIIVTSPPWYANCYIVQHRPTGELVVVDPGGDADKILAAVAALGGTPREILLTHGHPDHLGAADEVQKALGIVCRAHIKEAALVQRPGDFSLALMGRPMKGPEQCAFFDGAEAQLELGGTTFTAIHTPGHTPGGVCFVFAGFVLTGDTLFNQGVGRTDLPGGDSPGLSASISMLLDQLPDEAMLFAGHGPHWSAREARLWWRRMAVMF